ncbi:O-methyltransferase [Candidatus Sumerlaeota bacterium]|nr:O-methyltransferase [Candidatus Sumerlaeota bacterium]
MTEKSRPVTEAHFRYVQEHTQPEGPLLRDLRREAAEAGIPTIAIAPEQGSLMQILLRLVGAREVVEVGTLYGLASIWMARGLPQGGRVRTIEIDDAHADFAERWIARSDVADRIEIVRGAGRDILPTLEDDSVDAVFLDADRESYGIYLPECLRIIRPGGLLMVDNAFAGGRVLDAECDHPSGQAMRTFNDMVAREPRLRGVIVPIGDGLWVITVLG